MAWVGMRQRIKSGGSSWRCQPELYVTRLCRKLGLYYRRLRQLQHCEWTTHIEDGSSGCGAVSTQIPANELLHRNKPRPWRRSGVRVRCASAQLSCFYLICNSCPCPSLWRKLQKKEQLPAPRRWFFTRYRVLCWWRSFSPRGPATIDRWLPSEAR